jgi:hypothetical protein
MFAVVYHPPMLFKKGKAIPVRAVEARKFVRRRVSQIF